MAAVEDWHIEQCDVDTAFLHGNLEETLFMEAPEGSSYPAGTILRLKKSLYGLKQAPRAWNKRLHEYIISAGFRRCHIDQSVYIRGSGSSAIIIAVYVDDLLIFGHDIDFIRLFKSNINSVFKIKDLGPVRSILGMTVTRDRRRRTITLSLSDYIRTLLDKHRIDPNGQRRDASVPMTKATFNTAIDGDSKLAKPLDSALPFRSIIGGLLYANVCTRPDISFAVSSIASHTSDPKHMHWLALIDVLKYLRDTQDLCLTYGGNVPSLLKNRLEVYADSDFSKHPDVRKSRSGYVLYFNGGPVAWHSSLQKRTAISTSEAELYALFDANQLASWFKELLGELGFPQLFGVMKTIVAALIGSIFSVRRVV